MPVDRIEVDPRRDRDAGLLDEAAAKAQAVVREVADVGVEIERAVGWGDAAQADARQLGEQALAVLRVLRDRGDQLGHVVEGGERGVLRQARRHQEQVDEVVVQRAHAGGRRDDPAQAPARHAKELREAVEDDRVRVERECRRRFDAVADAVVDLVGDHARAVLAAALDQCGELAAREHRPGRVRRAGDDQAVQRLGERVEHRRLQAIVRVGAAIDLDRRAAERLQRVAVGRIAGPRDADAVARREQGDEHRGQAGARAAGQQHALGRDLDAVRLRVVARDALLQRRRKPVAARVAVEARVRRRARAGRDAGRRLAEVHRDHRQAGAQARHREQADLAGVEGFDRGAARREGAGHGVPVRSGRHCRHRLRSPPR